MQALPEGQELVRTASPQKGTGWGTTGQALPVQLPTSPSGQWEIGVRLFDRKENGQVRGFAVLEGKKKVSKGELAPQKPIEVFLHYREPSKE